MKHQTPFLLLALSLLTSCLTVEKKEYHIKLRSDHGGEAAIKFVNIMSEADDTVDVSDDDFRQLIESYLLGNQLEKENPGYHNVRKRLFEENGVLCGELSFTFDSLSVVRILKYDRESPYMYAVGSPLSSEQYLESNGELLKEWMPVIFWPRDTKEFVIKTKVISEVSSQRSLLKNFRAWQQAGQKQKKQ